jgi:TolB-like protein
MVDETGRVKVMDFGLMRSTTSAEPITQTGIFFGTPEYASPEQCETKNVDGRTDIYSLGAVLYEMLTGRMPHVAETPLALFKKISEETPLSVRELNPKVSKDVARLVERMMAKKREERYETCAQLVADIDLVLAGSRPATGRAAAPKSTALAGAIAAGVIAVAVVASFLLWRGSGPAAGSGEGSKSAQPVRLQNPLMVVFDFKNGTSDADASWYEIALSDMLIASLAQRGGIRVPTRDQMLGKVKELTLGEKVTDANQKRLLSELGAHFYLAGKFYVKAQKVRITLACYRAADSEPAFPPMSFEKLESEVFSLVDEMAAAVTGGLERVAEPIPGSASRTPAPVADLALAMLEPRREAEGDDRSKDAKLAHPAETPPPPPRADPKAPAPAAVAGKVDGERQRGKTDKGGNLAAVGGVERMKHWYANRQLAEKCGYEEDDVKVLVENLKEQFQLADEDAGQLQKGLEHFRRSLNDATEARKQGVKNLKEIVDYCCLECEAVSQRVPGECPKCKTPLAIRIQLKQQQQEKKE